MTKTIEGWDWFVQNSKRDPILVPLWAKRRVTVHYPTKAKLNQIFDKQGNLRLPEATLALFGEKVGQEIVEKAQDEQGLVAEWMTMKVLAEFGFLNKTLLEQFERNADDEGGTEDGQAGGDPNPTSASSSSTGGDPSSNGTSPNGSALTSSTTSAD